MSRSTLLRLIRAVPESAQATPRVLGIDEFALRKGHVYATVLVGIETRRVVGLLPDRTVETVSARLPAHPGVEVICRDRSASFGEAGRLGAPGAIHVADRYHLWRNLPRPSTNLSLHTPDDLRAIEDKLNNRPARSSAGKPPPTHSLPPWHRELQRCSGRNYSNSHGRTQPNFPAMLHCCSIQ